jgi:hypothetical protein
MSFQVQVQIRVLGPWSLAGRWPWHGHGDSVGFGFGFGFGVAGFSLTDDLNSRLAVYCQVGIVARTKSTGS